MLPAARRSHQTAIACVALVALLAGGCAAFPLVPTSVGSGGGLFRARASSPWTILCLELQGPNRSNHIEQIVETLKRTPGIRPEALFTTDDPDGFARLYYGRYERRTDPRTGKRSTPRRLVEDVRMIKELSAGPGQYYFLRALTVRMPTPNVGRPEWNLARTNATYSLQVALFEPRDGFWQYKQAAAEYCAALREKGFEAYYYHSDASSTVTVGLFGPEAVVENPRGLPSYSPRVLALQRRDELLQFNRLNGAIYRAPSDTGHKVRVPSRLVRIPQPEPT